MGGGSVFSSPALSVHPHQVIGASLAGTVLAAQPVSYVPLPVIVKIESMSPLHSKLVITKPVQG